MEEVQGNTRNNKKRYATRNMKLHNSTCSSYANTHIHTKIAHLIFRQKCSFRMKFEASSHFSVATTIHPSFRHFFLKQIYYIPFAPSFFSLILFGSPLHQHCVRMSFFLNSNGRSAKHSLPFFFSTYRAEYVFLCSILIKKKTR